MMVSDITVIILTKNEEKNIEDCLKSLKNFAKRIVIVDSGSTDKTIEIANKYNVDVYFHDFENYAKQFNWGIDNTNISTHWTMRLDADERLTPELCLELENLMNINKNTTINGITMEAWLYFMGKKIKYGGPKKRKLMVFKTGIGRIEDRNMDEHTILKKGDSIAAKEKFLHYDFKNLTFFIDKLNWYASREVLDYFDYINQDLDENLKDKAILSTRKKKFGFYYKFPMFIRSWLLFIYFYIFRLGFLDGKEGFIYHYLYQRWYRMLVDAKIYEKIQKK
ncbi:glycosyltransferase family 2 protein [Carnobacterium sp. 1290_CSPC]|uniref:glycosyltransferase family 2 protein n=1 Tax=Carnobacterium sp. 1290_CSPC TaxID=1579347 RepID=UPI001CEF690D|nr:glycosyltransferase family 2 protein [Carnobacterium sp. 1290_CSPC]